VLLPGPSALPPLLLLSSPFSQSRNRHHAASDLLFCRSYSSCFRCQSHHNILITFTFIILVFFFASAYRAALYSAVHHDSPHYSTGHGPLSSSSPPPPLEITQAPCPRSSGARNTKHNTKHNSHNSQTPAETIRRPHPRGRRAHYPTHVPRRLRRRALRKYSTSHVRWSQSLTRPKACYWKAIKAWYRRSIREPYEHAARLWRTLSSTIRLTLLASTLRTSSAGKFEVEVQASTSTSVSLPPARPYSPEVHVGGPNYE
jgi:hypothetical protein